MACYSLSPTFKGYEMKCVLKYMCNEEKHCLVKYTSKLYTLML
jgi:hypothetical protein